MYTIEAPETDAPINPVDWTRLSNMGVNAAQTMLDAAQLIRERGMAKGERVNLDGAMCIHGAVAVALGVDPSFRKNSG